MPTVRRVHALEILDSRGRPTLKAYCELSDGTRAAASVPSGASTGAAEALEKRDGDGARHAGLGCRMAAQHVGGEIDTALRGKAFTSQAGLDAELLKLDGTPNKARLGANALLGVSLAFARASAAQAQVPLYQHFASQVGDKPRTLPRLTVNLFSGGKHAGGQVPIQDVLLVPSAAKTVDEGLAAVCAVYRAAAKRMLERFGMRLLTADEGGLAPPFEGAEAMLAEAVAAIEAAGFEPGREVALAVDVASSHFFENGLYHLDGAKLSSAEMIAKLRSWAERFPIVSIEDGLAEDDWAHWPELRRALCGRALTLGDDFLCTHPKRIERALAAGAADALLLKVNQIGTLTEAAEARRLARNAGWKVTISARSGETEDDWMADLAVGWSGDQIKVGSITQSERLAKYNRLLEIEAETHLPVAAWPG